VVVSQQAAQSLMALDGAGGPADFIARVDEFVVETLMISLCVIVSLELGQSFSQ